MPKYLIAVTTCLRPDFVDKALAQIETWVPALNALPDVDVRFFVGRRSTAQPGTEMRGHLLHPLYVQLDVRDTYEDLPYKVQGVFAWALAQGYTDVCKVDDDTYVTTRVVAARNQAHDYVGNRRAWFDSDPGEYSSGFCYWLSAKAMRLVVDSPRIDSTTYEDLFVGRVMNDNRTQVTNAHEPGFICTYPGVESAAYLWRNRAGKEKFAFAQYPAHKMREMHSEFMKALAAGNFKK